MTERQVPIGKLVVVGVGLIGGSCALALRAGGAVGEVVGVGRSRANLDAALALGIVDRAVTLQESWTAELADADVVLVAAPVAQYPALFAAIAPAIGERTVVSDAGSTKLDVVAAARGAFGSRLRRFVPAHPIAGTENSGAAAAFPTLYRDRTVILAPLAETDADAVQAIENLWLACGARLRRLDAARHDRIYAAVSHLPHLLAFAFVDSIAARPDAAEYLDLAGAGFRDFTRIAASSPEMWRDIFLANRPALQAELGAFRAKVDAFETAMLAGDAKALDELIECSRAARRGWAADRARNASDSPGGDAT